LPDAAGSVPALWFEELESTNAEARRRADAGETGPLWLAARRQTAGRGRRGRSWKSGQGNLAATLLMTTLRDAAEAAQLSFVAAFAVRELAVRYVPEALVRLKWPNDVLICGAKTAGVLIESGRREGAGLWLAIGIGVNLASAPEGLGYPATSLAAHLGPDVPRAPNPDEALVLLSEAFVRWRTIWERDGFEPLRAEWTRCAVGLGGPCLARLGDREIQGVAMEMDSGGGLVLRLASGELQRITAGDVFFGGRAH
jgi:BirA family biotin operon repressor/biotin-[acetyl-CoA-carboxylase] ligase